MERDSEARDTHSFKLSSTLLGYILTFIIAALGGGTITTAIQPAPAINNHYVTRQEYELWQKDVEKRLNRIEQKLDWLIDQQQQNTRRR